MRIFRGVIAVIIVCGAFALAPSAQAQTPTPTCEFNENAVWREQRLDNFAVIYLATDSLLGEGILALYADQLEIEYAALSTAFDHRLETPITIRVYPTRTDFACLNAQPYLLPEETTHSHVGTREIALIGNAIQADITAWQAEALNAFRHEMVILFVEDVTAGFAPPGLLLGSGAYAENPPEAFYDLAAAANLTDTPRDAWPALWDQPDYRAASELQNVSIVAYLIDVYGWGAYVDFLRALPEEQAYRPALQTVYGYSLNQMESGWQTYFPQYMSVRWQTNAIHNYDLATIETLVEGGAYVDALATLDEAFFLLETFDDPDGLAAAEALHAQAQTGVQAGDLAAIARQAYLDGDFTTAAAQAQASLDLYFQLDDARRLDEVSAYRDQANEVLALRQEIEDLSAAEDLRDPLVVQRLAQIAERLTALGDPVGADLALEALNRSAQQQSGLVVLATGVLLLVILWILFRFIQSLRKPPPPEADLL